MERSTAGVTGMREFEVGCWSCVVSDLGTAVDEPDVVDEGMMRFESNAGT
jgi:hypothetical protein